MEKFRQHSCQHPLIPLNDANNTFLMAAEIHEGAVLDMYTYCNKNDLSQVWAYLWNSWYHPDKWVLWARSASECISVLRTTMVVEGFWNHLKHTTLTSFNRPRIDLIVHLILTQVIPTVNLKLSYHMDRRRLGHPKSLAPWQYDFKKLWADYSKPDDVRRTAKEKIIISNTRKTKAWRQERLDWLQEEEEREAGTYNTSLHDWTCSCPSYLHSRFLICKHLIRLANMALGEAGIKRDLQFFYNLRRQ
ncbi:hypothetical protein BS47DRAFT_1293351 [Hydnum rufescens UP504]|uniref:SWIM-type domain-containing protein n=1 Tax=Hydnum rufescens UP504 TaxID=1448309 RepID=A0A9P6B1A1_9AGAM|nr:hypothetical protein BS47DRAFT_1293351 [Hydnum rufescens UP504]